MSLLYNRALLLAEIETAFREENSPPPDETDNAVLVEDPVFSADATILDRNNVKVHLSPDPGTPGRKIATVSFSHEVRHNGNTDGTVSGKLGVLLRGCGFAETNIAAASTDTILASGPSDNQPTPVNSPDGAFTYAKTTAYAGTLPRVVELECTTPGGSGVAQFSVFSPAVGTVQTEESYTAVTMTDATTFDLVESAQITPTVVTSFATGDRFIINVTPPGYCYEPVSTGFESLNLWVYYDGLLHKLEGCRGTFTGDYNNPTDTALPTSPVYETTIPPQVELSNLVAAGGQDDVDFDLCAQSFSIDIANNVVARECINEKDSLAGAIITGRSPTASFNPETTLEAEHPFWANLNSATRVSFGVRVGSEQGNTVTFFAPYAQYASLAYGNRNDIRIYDVNMRLNTDADVGGAGNDELRICFS
jgi:hypothetical protein